ncbi:hypothetical protein A2V71_00405 [Candidatus Berkelbacteria bacterium RBG_13_40_8]|uniref:Uncharacterized protein n=1 Tax=Candidatus Berkelbacteria bacterium RBG_13_40_8 TaxID=1797467 RepID=A0A1F5DLN7_9BACT|nr:MAG: hypothetical protein A2V71_00405 [Candidatus Berkelbacteria bacterium RBG_13_40_8]
MRIMSGPFSRIELAYEFGFGHPLPSQKTAVIYIREIDITIVKVRLCLKQHLSKEEFQMMKMPETRNWYDTVEKDLRQWYHPPLSGWLKQALGGQSVIVFPESRSTIILTLWAKGALQDTKGFLRGLAKNLTTINP